MGLGNLLFLRNLSMCLSETEWQADRRRWREWAFVFLFSLQMAVTAGGSPTQSQEAGIPFGFPVEWKRSKSFSSFPGSEREQQGLEAATWESDIAGSSSTYCTVTTVPETN